jgi:hypothetical protein
MAAVAVAKWALGSTPAARVFGDVLAVATKDTPSGKLMVAPRSLPPSRQVPRLGISLWATGTQVCSLYGGMTVSSAKP